MLVYCQCRKREREKNNCSARNKPSSSYSHSHTPIDAILGTTVGQEPRPGSVRLVNGSAVWLLSPLGLLQHGVHRRVVVVAQVVGVVEPLRLDGAVAVAQVPEAVRACLSLQDPVLPPRLLDGLEVVQRRPGPQTHHLARDGVAFVPGAARVGPDWRGGVKKLVTNKQK